MVQVKQGYSQQHRQVIKHTIHTHILLLQNSVFTAADAPPAVGEITAQSPTSILVQWDPISRCQDINGNIIGYSISYLALPDGPTETELVPGTWNVGGQVTLSGLSPFTEYSIQIAAVNNQSEVGVYSDPITRQTHEDSETWWLIVYTHLTQGSIALTCYTPSFSAAPGSVIISLSKTTFQIFISWSPPEMPNGIIIAYELSYLQTANPQNVTHMNTTDQATSLALYGLQPETQYTFIVRAYTQAGAGEESIVIYTTSDRPGNSSVILCYSVNMLFSTFTGVFFQLRLDGVLGCQEWVVRHISTIANCSSQYTVSTFLE